MTRTVEPSLVEFLAIADALREGGDQMNDPQDLPGRYGRVIHALDRLLQTANSVGAIGGGWATWHHGYVGRVTQDVDVLVPADRVEELLRVAPFSGFDVLPSEPGRWPKLRHRETDIVVDFLPEGQRPGTVSRPAPTVLPHPSTSGAESALALKYVSLASLVEMKLAAGRAKDESDVIELIRSNHSRIASVRAHLASVHGDYVIAFDRLIARADAEAE